MRQQMQVLRLTLSKINDWVWERPPVRLTTALHPYRPGNVVWVKECNVQPLKPHQRGPFFAILTTPIAVKVAEIAPCIHYSQVNPVSLEWECIPNPAPPSKIALQKISPSSDKEHQPPSLAGLHFLGKNRGP
jgi:hypothetical protein